MPNRKRKQPSAPGGARGGARGDRKAPPEDAVKETYCFWTNKGGVGKTTLCFHSLLTYALLHPEETVLAVDADPQCNLSQSLLTHCGGGTGDEKEFRDGMDNVEDFQDQKVEGKEMYRTLAGYLQAQLANVQTPEVLGFTIRVHDYNPNVPENVVLLCGDTRLPLLEGPLLKRAGTDQDVSPLSNPWVQTHNMMKNFITCFANSTRRESKQRTVAFIDTNPAEIMSTKMSLVAARKLVVPINADDFSKAALKNMFNILFGLFHDGDDSFVNLHKQQFYYLARQYQVPLPVVHAVIHNKSPLTAGTAVKAFKSLQGKQADLLFSAYQKAREKKMNVFSLRGQTPTTAEQLAGILTGTMRDMASAGVVSTHSGIPLWRLKRLHKAIRSDLGSTNFQSSAQASIADIIGLARGASRSDSEPSASLMQLIMDKGDVKSVPLEASLRDKMYAAAKVTRRDAGGSTAFALESADVVVVSPKAGSAKKKQKTSKKKTSKAPSDSDQDDSDEWNPEDSD